MLMFFLQELRNQVRRIATGENDTHQSVKHRTVFHELLQSDLYRDGSVPEKLFYHEAASITAAGIDTTKSTLTMASFWISKKREVYDRLHKELVEAIPDTNNFPSLTELEKLPYLEAVIKECECSICSFVERGSTDHGPSIEDVVRCLRAADAHQPARPHPVSQLHYSCQHANRNVKLLPAAFPRSVP